MLTPNDQKLIKERALRACTFKDITLHTAFELGVDAALIEACGRMMEILAQPPARNTRGGEK